jgi:hypothetical protein
LVLAFALAHASFSIPLPAQEEMEPPSPEAGGEHLRVETEHGPIHLWRPAKYNPRTAGVVLYVHGYFTSVDQTWVDDQLATQFRASGRNALFIAIKAPQSDNEDIQWRSLAELLDTVEKRTPFHVPRGPLVVLGHSGGFRTLLSWLHDSRLQYVILLDGLYGGEAEFRSWLRPSSRTKPHRMVLVASETWHESDRFARRIYGTARRGIIPTESSSFTRREIWARLLYLRSQYDHNQIVSGGKVIPVLLQIAPLPPLAATQRPVPTTTVQKLPATPK